MNPMENAIALCIWQRADGWRWAEATDSKASGQARPVARGPFDSEIDAMVKAKFAYPEFPISFKRDKPQALVILCVWEESTGWYWDDSEDHGGFDRISPMGPHASASAAQDDARICFADDTLQFIDGARPAHYPQ